MSAVEALKVARSFGIRLGVDGDDLVLKGSAQPPPREFNLLRRHKAEIMGWQHLPALRIPFVLLWMWSMGATTGSYAAVRYGGPTRKFFTFMIACSFVLIALTVLADVGSTQ